MPINPKLIDQLIGEYKKPEDIMSEDGLLKRLTKAVLDRALQALAESRLRIRERVVGAGNQPTSV